jgi:hypothetical protein
MSSRRLRRARVRQPEVLPRKLATKAAVMCAATLTASTTAEAVAVVRAHVSRAGEHGAELLAVAVMCMATEDVDGVVAALAGQPILPRPEEV